VKVRLHPLVEVVCAGAMAAARELALLHIPRHHPPCLANPGSAVFFIYWLMLVFTGTLQPGLYGVMVVSNYQYRIWTYVTMVENQYPRFGLPSA
jgi:hypothetical protein